MMLKKFPIFESLYKYLRKLLEIKMNNYYYQKQYLPERK